MHQANQTKARILPIRRLALLATTVAGLAVGGILVAPTLSPFAPHALAQNLSQEAQQVARPTGFADIVEKVKPAVFSVRVKVRAEAQPSASLDDENPFPKGSPMEKFFKRFGMPEGGPGGQGGPSVPRGRQFGQAQGSGFFISADGYAVTNNHVVEKATTVEISTDEGKTYTAKVIGTDPRTDLALIKVEGSNFPYVKLAEAAPRIGDWVLAVGNPFGLGGTVTAGIVSARGRDIGAGPYDDFLQIDAPVNKGNSGGPTFNTEGSVIGVNTAIFSPSGGVGRHRLRHSGGYGEERCRPAQGQGIGDARLDRRADPAGDAGDRRQPGTEEACGCAGRRAAEGWPGRQGRRPVWRRHRDREWQSGSRCARPCPQDRRHGSGHDRQARHCSRRCRKTLNLTLGELPNAREARADTKPEQKSSNEPRLGLSLTPGGSEPGVVVAEVDPSGPAADFGFKAGDVILEVGGQTVATPAEVGKALGKAREDGKRSVLMRVKSEQGTRFVAIPLSRA